MKNDRLKYIEVINNKQTQKVKLIYVFIINFFMLFCTYGIFTKMHYAIDTYDVYFNSSASQHLLLGRLVGYVITSLLNYMKINTVTYQVYFFILFIFIISIFITYLVKQICNYVNNLSYLKLFLVNSAILISFVNIYFLEWFLYPESFVTASVNLFTLMLAIFFIVNRQNIINIILSFVFLSISLNMYQINIGFFIIFSLTLVLLKYDFTPTKTAVKESFVLIIVGFLSGVFNIFIIDLMKKLGIIAGTSRDIQLNLPYLMNNFKILFTQGQYVIWINGSGFMPKYVMIIFLIAFISLLVYSIVKKKIELENIIYIFIVLLINYSIIYAPHILTSTIWLAPRTIVGIFAFITSIVLIIIKLDISFEIKKVSFYAILVFLLVNIVQIQDISMNHFASNKIDREYVSLIYNEIEKYEKENNINVLNIACVNDIAPTYGYYNNVKYISYDTNIRAFFVSWADINIINYYTGRNFKKIEMDEQVYNKYFKDKNWSYYNPNEQMLFINDTLYMIMY